MKSNNLPPSGETGKHSAPKPRGSQGLEGSTPSSGTTRTYGPYLSGDTNSAGNRTGRKVIILCLEDGTRKTQSYARWLYEQAHGPLPKGTHVHHVNGDCTDDRLENLSVLSATEHLRQHNVKPPEDLYYSGICPHCDADFQQRAKDVRHNRALGNSGPYCSRSCAGKHTHPSNRSKRATVS